MYKLGHVPEIGRELAGEASIRQVEANYSVMTVD